MTKHTSSLDLPPKKEQLLKMDTQPTNPIPSPLAEILLKILARLQTTNATPESNENSD